MKYKGDYQEADVPMLGATRDGLQVGLQVILYAWATVASSLLLIPVAGMGLVYTASALVFGGWFIVESHVLYNRAVRGEQIRPMRVFHASITYLTLLFVAIAIDGTVTWNGTPVNMVTLRQYLDVAAGMVPEPELHFQPDRQARYEAVDRTLAVIKRSKVTKLGFIGNEQYYRDF